MKFVKTYETYLLKNIIREDNWYDDAFGVDKYKEYIKPDMNLFLIDFEYTFDWVKKHNPYMITNFGDHYDMDVKDLTKDMIAENEVNIKNHIITYMKLYQKWKLDGFIYVYRTLNVNSLDEIDWKNLGLYWSFIDETSKYGRSRDFVDSNHKISIHLYSRIPLTYVNWENSLDNYCYYGNDENEVKLKRKRKLIITKYQVVNKEKKNNAYYVYKDYNTYDNVNIVAHT
jgi:hypothetical protein